MNNNFCSITIYYLLYNDIWYHINYHKYTNSIYHQFFHYLLFYIKPDTKILVRLFLVQQTFHYIPIIHFNWSQLCSFFCLIMIFVTFEICHAVYTCINKALRRKKIILYLFIFKSTYFYTVTAVSYKLANIRPE